MATKKKKTSMPSVPSPAPVTVEKPKAAIDIGDYNQFYQNMIGTQIGQYDNLIRRQIELMPEVGAANLAYAQQVVPGMTQIDIQRNMALLPADLQRQQQMMGGAFGEQTREAGLANQFQLGEAQKYGQQYVDLFNQYAQGSNPEFMNTYNALAGRVQSGLEQGYQLGPDLQREIDQSIRGGQAARGNYLGPAPTAQEAFGTGETALNLYNTRLSQAQGFLQGKQPTDLWGTMGLSMPSMQLPQVQQGYYPDSAGAAGYSATQGATNWLQNIGLDPSVAPNLFNNYNATMVGAQSAYNSALIEAQNVNNASIFSSYDKSFDQFLYKQSVAHGLYNTPSAPSAGASQAGAIIGGVGSAVGAVGSAAAASAAAAAFCWLARRCLPKRWREWREFLFTRAPAAFRRKYIYGAKTLAYSISMEEEEEIAELMSRCLRKRS